MSAPPGRLARLSLRWRLMALGLAGVSGALVIGGVLLFAVMSTALERSTVTAARASALDVAALVDDGRLPDPVPVGGALVVQVLDPANRVTGGSVTADRLTSMVSPVERRALDSGQSLVVPGSRVGVDGDLRVVGVEAGPATARVLVVAGVPTADLETSRRVLGTLLLVLLPLFLLVLALIAWRVIGLALAPVEQLRRGAARIGGEADPTERLPVLPARDEVSALAQTLNEMLERLWSANAKQRAFVADAAHELRSPLATMRTQLEVAQRLGDGGDLPAELLPEVARLSALVEDLLELARTERAQTPPPGRVSLVRLVQEVTARYGAARVPVRAVVSDAEAAAGDAELLEAAAGDAELPEPVVTASSADLDRALANLLDNAIRHARSRVVVTTGVRAGTAFVEVQDDGHGIAPSESERVFDRFARLEEARDRDTGGSGLGLPIARELLRRNGARIRLEPGEPGVRAVVEFLTPVGRPEPGGQHEPGGQAGTLRTTTSAVSWSE